MFISGGIRNSHDTISSIIDFCENFKIDIFLVIDKSEKKEDIDKIIEICKPKGIIYVTSINANSHINMWYKIKLGYKLIKKYEKQTNTKYDYYIRARYDIIIDNYDKNCLYKLDNKNILYIGKRKFFIKNDYILLNFILSILNDEFFMGNNKIMKIYCNFYDIIIKSNNSDMQYNLSEYHFFQFLKLYYHEYKVLDILHSFKHQKTPSKHLLNLISKIPYFLNSIITKFLDKYIFIIINIITLAIFYKFIKR